MAQDKIKPLKEAGVIAVSLHSRLVLKCLKFSSSLDS
jgi:hypothetical protein